jgi:hypothetical protein
MNSRKSEKLDTTITGLQELKGELGDKYIPLVHMISKDFRYSKVISEVIEGSLQEKFSQAVLSVSFEVNTTLNLINDLVLSEFENRKDHITTILRQNSFASKLMTKYTKVVGSGYLRYLLHENVKSLYENQDIILDPDTKNVTENLTSETIENNLSKFCQKIFDDLIEAGDRMPRELKAICYYIHKAGKKYDIPSDIIVQLISGFVILRYVGPGK